ncbi:hypothetical protein ACF0H5_023115 [Mactra antiquata]
MLTVHLINGTGPRLNICIWTVDAEIPTFGCHGNSMTILTFMVGLIKRSPFVLFIYTVAFC